MTWREILMSVLLLGVAVFLWQLLKEEDPETLVDEETQEVLPGYYLNDAELTRFNESGQAQYTMRALKIEQDPRTDTLTLSDISVEYHEHSQWLITADSALLPASRETIQFIGNVIATQSAASPDDESIQFIGDSLNYHIKDQQLMTSEMISASKGEQVISAQGMLLDMANERIQLLSQVKIRYLP